MDEQSEELEQIPWSTLATATPDPRMRMLLVAGGVVIAVILGLLAARLIGGGSEATVVTLTPMVEPAPLPTAPEGPTPPEGPVAPVAVLAAGVAAAPNLYSEADLMAVPVAAESRLAAMRAEWFVTDFFTVDGDDRIRALLSSIYPEAPLPHDEPTAASYVEWASAYRVEPQAPGTYRVWVAYRLLVSTEGSGFRRREVSAVTVDLAIGVDGSAQILNLPVPAAVPHATGAEVAVNFDVEVPPGVADQAVATAAASGWDVNVVGAAPTGDGWTVLMMAGDAGLRWPVQMFVPES